MVHRLVPTHIPVDEVFTTYEIFYRLCLDQSFSDSDLAILCLIAQLRILGILGYWNSDWTDEVLHTTGKTFEYVSQNKRSVEKLIERILVDTQMVIKGFQE